MVQRRVGPAPSTRPGQTKERRPAKSERRFLLGGSGLAGRVNYLLIDPIPKVSWAIADQPAKFQISRPDTSMPPLWHRRRHNADDGGGLRVGEKFFV